MADDDNHRIQRFTPEGAWQGEAGEPGRGPGQFSFPYGVALDAAGDVFVADNINARVVKLSPGLAFLGAWGGPGSKPGQLAFPRAIAADPAGDTYVTDTANGRIEVFDPQGNLLRTIGSSGRGPGALVAPEGLAVDPTGSLFVSDTVDNRLERFSAAGAYTGQWGGAGGHFNSFNAPAGIAVDPRGTVYVADRGNGRVARIWGDGTFLGELGGPLQLGGAQLSSPGSVAVDPATGNIYVADTLHNRVLLYTARRLAGGQVGSRRRRRRRRQRPGAVRSHPRRSRSDRAARCSWPTPGTTAWSPSPPPVRVQATWGERGMANGHFRIPDGIAVDAAGRVFVADRENNRVQEFSSTGTYLAKWGARGVGPGRIRPADGARGRLLRGRVRRRHPQQPRPELRPAVRRPPGGACPRAPGRRRSTWPPSCTSASPARTGFSRGGPCRWRWAASGPARSSSAPGVGAPGRRALPAVAVARALSAAQTVRRAAAHRAPHAAAPAPGARRPPAPDGDGEGRRGGSHRQAHGAEPDLPPDPLVAVAPDAPGNADNGVVASEELFAEEDLPGINHRRERVRLETERHRIEGLLTLARDGYRSRVSDVLNASERDFITLTDVTVEPLEGGPVELHAYMSLARRHIIFAVAAPEEGR